MAQLHQGSQITSLLHYERAHDGTKYLVSCSELPNPELTISEVSSDLKSVKIIAKGKDEFADDCQCGYTCLAQNPLYNDRFAAASQVIEDSEKGISLWEVNPEAWKNSDTSVATAPGKRARTDIARIGPLSHLKCQNGV